MVAPTCMIRSSHDPATWRAMMFHCVLLAYRFFGKIFLLSRDVDRRFLFSGKLTMIGRCFFVRGDVCDATDFITFCIFLWLF